MLRRNFTIRKFYFFLVNNNWYYKKIFYFFKIFFDPVWTLDLDTKRSEIDRANYFHQSYHCHSVITCFALLLRTIEMLVLTFTLIFLEVLLPIDHVAVLPNRGLQNDPPSILFIYISFEREF